MVTYKSKATYFIQGFHKEYKDFIFHGKGGIFDHVKSIRTTSREPNNDLPNLVGRNDVEGLLREAFVVDVSSNDIVHDVDNEPLDEGVEPFDMYDGRIPSE